MYNSCHNDTHTNEQFLKISVGFGLVFVRLFRLDFCCSCIACFVVLGLVSSALRQESGWEERRRNALFCIEGDVKP